MLLSVSPFIGRSSIVPATCSQKRQDSSSRLETIDFSRPDDPLLRTFRSLCKVLDCAFAVSAPFTSSSLTLIITEKHIVQIRSDKHPPPIVFPSRIQFRSPSLSSFFCTCLLQRNLRRSLPFFTRFTWIRAELLRLLFLSATMSTASPLHHGHGNGSYVTNSPAPTGVTGRDAGVTAAAVADSAVRSGSVPASASGSAPGSASGSMYGDGHAHHTAHHHHSGHHAHSHGALASPVNGGHSSSWSPYGYPSAPSMVAAPALTVTTPTRNTLAVTVTPTAPLTTSLLPLPRLLLTAPPTTQVSTA